MQNARNAAIVLGIAAAVMVVPGGGRAADLVWAILSIVFAGGLALFAGRMYLERRVELYTLEDNHRAILYGSVAVLVVALTAASRLAQTGPGTLGLLVLFAISLYGLFHVYTAWRQY
jgi:hypothetical protein